MCSKVGFVAGLVVLLSATGCGPTPPSPLIYPTNNAGSDTGGNGTTGGTIQDPNTGGTPDPNPGPTNPGGGGGNPWDPNQGGSGNPNTQNPNTQNPNTGNPNTGNPAPGPKPVAAFFSLSATDPNIMFVVLSSDAQFCTHLTASQIKKGSADTELQINAPATGKTYTIPNEAQLDTLSLNDKCDGKPVFASNGNVTLNLVTSALTTGSYSYTSGNVTGSGNFNATACNVLAAGLPSTNGSSLSCQ